MVLWPYLRRINPFYSVRILLGGYIWMKKVKAEKLSGWVYLPDDLIEAEIVFRGMDWALTIWDLDEDLRANIKYGHKFKNADEALLWVRQRIQEILEDRNLTLDIII